jgi:DNA-binding winged helix-turn-helix (wHTH) protein/Flp pilus assembly protein TadD
MSLMRFGNFELDGSARELRLAGRAVTLQPRVFDLLSFLVKNCERVVTKEELLSASWPGVVVTDASLQRAVSLARSALRNGGFEDAIRTYARQGYRFLVEPSAGRDESPSTTGDVLVLARGSYAASDWDAALEQYGRADGESPLSARDLESWALSALCVGRLQLAMAPLERAVAGYLASDDIEAAARALLTLARVRLELREPDVALGCLRRAASLLQGLPAGAQHGYLAWMTARFHVVTGDLPQALAHANRCIEIGNQIGSLDLETIGKLYVGAALQAGGETERGLELQAEAAATVVSSNISPLVGGIVYCGLLAGYFKAGELQRAAQWTDSFGRWCERTNMRLFHGSCLLHRAEVLAIRGDLLRAQAEIIQGEEVLQSSAPWAIGDARRLLGDLHLMRGEFEQAETAYRSAREHGYDPYPGYAMLLHQRGQSAAALRGLRRAAEATHWVAGERHATYLATIVTIAALSGDAQCAAETLTELDEHPEKWPGAAVRATVFRARGELSFARGDCGAALASFRAAIRLLLELDARTDAAIVRLRLAACMARMGDTDDAELELRAALKPLEQSGARLYVEQCQEQLKSLVRRTTS